MAQQRKPTDLPSQFPLENGSNRTASNPLVSPSNHDLASQSGSAATRSGTEATGTYSYPTDTYSYKPVSTSAPPSTTYSSVAHGPESTRFTTQPAFNSHYATAPSGYNDQFPREEFYTSEHATESRSGYTSAAPKRTAVPGWDVRRSSDALPSYNPSSAADPSYHNGYVAPSYSEPQNGQVYYARPESHPYERSAETSRYPYSSDAPADRHYTSHGYEHYSSAPNYSDEYYQSSDCEDSTRLDLTLKRSKPVEDDLFAYMVYTHKKRRKIEKSYWKKTAIKRNRLFGQFMITFEERQRSQVKPDYGYESEDFFEENVFPGIELMADEPMGEMNEEKRKKLWLTIGKQYIPKAYRIFQQSTQTKQANCIKIAQLCQREVIRASSRGTRSSQLKEIHSKAKRAMREMLVFWKRNEREERELRKKAEREELEKRKREEEVREAKRQARKLNFLISQTELYGHFIGKKMGMVGEGEEEKIETLGEGDHTIDFDAASDEQIKAHAAKSAQKALDAQMERTMAFDADIRQKRLEAGDTELQDAVDQMDFVNPSLPAGSIEVNQPRMLTCTLKAYQLKGLNWLANLYEQGINGILADEMGLGKTVQSISLMAYLAETHNIWGPFLVITPASTLHNWQQEITKFAPSLKALPYWGNIKDRKVLRTFWNSKRLYSQDAPFHVLITSYQLIVSDEQFFRRIKWQYMILDEAQAIKSSTSARWKTLLSFNCRNRLLLTGTPIQNSMQELWALLHFIMPTLFDSHEEFSDWFSKDIESHSQNSGTLNEQQLRRLHMILKPFMLRRIKKDVENELADKIEKEIRCHMTARQKRMYQGLKEKITIDELLDKVTSLSDTESVASLMNLVMQFRKVCNHPELFERADAESSFVFVPPYYCHARPAKPNEVLSVTYSARGAIEYLIPKTLYKNGLLLHHETPSVTSRPTWSSVLWKFCIYHPEHIYSSLKQTSNTFSFLSLLDYGVGEAAALFTANLLWRCVAEGLRLKLDPCHEDLCSPNRLKYTITTKRPVASLWNYTHLSRPFAYLSRCPQAFIRPVMSLPIEFYCNDTRFARVQLSINQSPLVKTLTHPGFQFHLCSLSANVLSIEPSKVVKGRGDPLAEPVAGIDVLVPGPEKLIADSGKIQVLETMLPKLKSEGHRILIYFQMTKMIDLMEEYLNYRKYSYLRLDGSTSISDRRDMVSDWQSRPELFIFLLSTRAGGLGINLTAADTVIFYDSDWNPTVDQQAMDRAHRLGQTKQVTVYRLITGGSVEERILIRAKQKDQIQKVVINEGEFQQQVAFKSKEVLSLLLDDDELENTLQLEAERRKAKIEETTSKRGRGRGRGRGGLSGSMESLGRGRKRGRGSHSNSREGTPTSSLNSVPTRGRGRGRGSRGPRGAKRKAMMDMSMGFNME